MMIARGRSLFAFALAPAAGALLSSPEETAGQDVIIAVDDAMPEIRVTTSLADAQGILSVAGYDEIRVSVSRDSAVSLVTEITHILSAANRVAFVDTQDTLGYEAVLVMRDGDIGELRLRPMDQRHFAQTITAIMPVAVDVVVDPETPLSTVAWIQDQLVNGGVGQVYVRMRARQQHSTVPMMLEPSNRTNE
ncbi:MAG: hypothetical protein F4164_07725 [Gemmatimonadales bacterium]|nr:hypothetical protein [Gemmatimonadales bacterium]MYG49248.1 hypothetical protein [Gemmatimonadales bacterium]MYK01409.1 hypothetical protein [Candidatus Palauibacter ramosifaciens]